MKVAIAKTLAMLALGVVLAMLASASEADGASTHKYPQPQWFAHRGVGWNAPNTQDSRLAIAAAVTDPLADGIESDVWATSDGHGIMQHDNDLSVATNCTGKVSDYTWAWLRANCRMDDGSMPQSMYEYLHAVVDSGTHAILHDKSAALTGYIITAMKSVAGARTLVRVMPPNVTELEKMNKALPGYYFEYAVSGAISSTVVARARAHSNWRVLVVPSALSGSAPTSWLKPLFDGGVPTDFVTYNAAQDAQVVDWPFGRVLSADIARSKTITGW